MSDDKVTPLPVRAKPLGKMLEVVRSFGKCEHRRATVDEQLAELTCSDCGAKLNPIQYLVQIANKLSAWEWEHERIVAARKQLAERKRARCPHCDTMFDIRIR
jgi:Zn finger protein HypA/HybF involved in hydrogenase expression